MLFFSEGRLTDRGLALAGLFVLLFALDHFHFLALRDWLWDEFYLTLGELSSLKQVTAEQWEKCKL